MSMQHRHVTRRRRMRLPVFALFGGLLISLQLVLCSPALVDARPVIPALATPPTSSDFARAEVSVVRLLASYVPPPPAPGAPGDTGVVAQCWGLGVIVQSHPSLGPQDQNNWVLTTTNVVGTGSESEAPCGGLPGKLSSVQIYMSSAYNAQQTITFSTTGSPRFCPSDIPTDTLSTGCGKDLALIAFSDATMQVNNVPLVNTVGPLAEPSLDLATQTAGQQTAIGLTKKGAAPGKQLALPTPAVTNGSGLPGLANPTVAQQELVNYLFPQKAAGKLEVGTPIINSAGALVALSNGSSTFSMSDLHGFLRAALPPDNTNQQNPVHDQWNTGIDYYYHNDFAKAQKAFQSAASANPHFQGAADFAASALALASAHGSELNGSSSGISILGHSIPLLTLSIAGLVLLALLLLLSSLLLGRSRARHRQALKEELAEANRRAALDAPRIKEREAAEQGWSQAAATNPLSAPLPPMQMSPSLHAPLMLRCPRCGEQVAADANYCTNCRLLLSPSESGLHLRVHPQQKAANTISNAAPAAPVAPAPPAASLADQPTQPSPPALVASRSIADLPTATIDPKVLEDGEKTMPYAVKHINGKHLAIVAGTNTNPGIKRQYKPNEDSLFAAQGMLDLPAAPGPFGLFVIADGMGGHANGQDASRMAIQTIISYVLPRLLNTQSPPSEADYAPLLVEGIQTANQAVHQQNMEQRGDMGTTTTAALVVDGVAYVANVGDSRTYLYRASEGGLRKVTNDHSVVASLVEAGIIKPDDIYTHPKRNQIYRSLGEKPAVEIDSFTVPLHDGDKLLLCSDGLWDMVRDPKIEDVLKQPAPNPNATTEALIKAALNGGGEDNVSVIVVQMTEAARASGTPGIQLLYKPDGVHMPQI